MGSMKVHQLARGFWEHEPSLTLGCKRLRPLAPKLANTDTTVTAFDLKTFIRPESGPRKLGSSDDKRNSPQVIIPSQFHIFHTRRYSIYEEHNTRPKLRYKLCIKSRFKLTKQVIQQVETHPGGTRWNPTQEQIGILEMLYRGGMRTPNAQQIEQITAQLGKYGKIEGKNVFYWFQNHKARERQKQKRNSLGISHCPRTPAASFTAISLDSRVCGSTPVSSSYFIVLCIY